ncbi:hypothetical protein JTB14_004048 [Gonioctena quinquepunctata]|nr:hypothetical protein JTB14_004048 [Gonioctena quinquepunctata]
MNNSRSIKKWKSFDFGPDTKEKCSTTLEVMNVNTDNKRVNKQNSRGAFTNKSFNFHVKLAPRVISDLAIHPKKIQEVHEWFRRYVVDPHPGVKLAPFLLLSGPTGSGKSATVDVICKTLGISISEWVNPMDQDFEYKGTNQVNQFLDFLIESKWNSLFGINTNKRITLVKDFPNAIVHQPDRFVDILEECQYKTRFPVIFICTEASSSSINLLRTLFPDEIINKFNIAHISFNACAPSLMKVAIQRAQMVVKENSQLFKQPSPKIIDAILTSAMGDIRNAVTQFHMASLLGTEELPTITTEAAAAIGTKRKRKSKDVRLKTMSRDENLGLFHGLGRILNPKRKEVGNSWRLERDVEKLVDEFSTQPQMVHAFLFENYPKYFGNIGEASKASEILSLSVKFLENWMDRHETLMFALWVSILGLMIFNEHKVSKWTQIRAPVKCDKNVKKDHMVRLNPTDYYYYNLINKSDKFHEFRSKI